jgi:hypothetical protein
LFKAVILDIAIIISVKTAYISEISSVSTFGGTGYETKPTLLDYLVLLLSSA